MLNKMRASPAWLAGVSIVPSVTSFVLCVLLSAAAVALHLLITCVRQGAILPNFLDGQWALVYGSTIRDPIDAFLEKTSFNNGALIVMWGIIGLIVYTIAEHGYRNFQEWREAEHDVQMIDANHVIYHPGERTFFRSLVWRVVLGCLFGLWGFAALAMVHRLMSYDGPPFFGLPRADFIEHVALLGVACLLTAHALVVLLRLAARRSRLFGQSRHMSSEETSFFRS